MHNRNAALLAVMLLSTGCGDGNLDDDELVVPEGCNPIAFEHDCMLPFPSDVFLQVDESTASGKRVVVGEAAALRDVDGGVVDPLTLHPADGFSPGSQILALFAQGIDDEPLVGATDDVTLSSSNDSPTLLIDSATGERMLHLAETDPRAPDDARRALIIRPLTRLVDGRRYIVAVRRLTTPAGAMLPAPRGFGRLRDGRAGGGVLKPLADRYETDIFEPLEAAGVDRSELQLAWDFTTRSRHDATEDMLRVRELVMSHLDDNAIVAEVVDVVDTPDAFTARRIELQIQVPLYLQSPDPLALLHRDPDGRVSQNGTADVPFTVWIPNSVASASAGAPPARLMQFGHGFFGSRDEVNGFVVELADERGFVVVAADWWGMSEQDRIPVVDQLNADMSQGARFTDRLHQAMANFIAVAHVARTTLAEVSELDVGPAPLYGPDPLYYYGISQGGIAGGTYLGLSPHIDRGALSVGGSNLSLMMFRAQPFLAFLVFVGVRLPDPLDQQKFVTLSQSTFDRIDPLTYAPLVIDDPPNGGPDTRRLLLQIGIGDAQVPNLASHLHARALGPTLLHLTPAPRPLAGLEPTAGPPDSAIVEFDFGIDPLPGETALPPTSDTEAHEGVRRLDAANEQLHRFFQPDGLVEHTCDGPCDPE